MHPYNDRQHRMILTRHMKKNLRQMTPDVFISSPKPCSFIFDPYSDLDFWLILTLPIWIFFSFLLLTCSIPTIGTWDKYKSLWWSVSGPITATRQFNQSKFILEGGISGQGMISMRVDGIQEMIVADLQQQACTCWGCFTIFWVLTQ